MHLEDLGLIGNCQVSALVERSGAIVWSCLPRFDSEPVFSSLLDHQSGGHFLVRGVEGVLGKQSYLPNTNVLETVFESDSGSFRVLDFAPRFVQHERVFCPTQLFRILEPLSGAPRVEVRCEPRLGWSKAVPSALHGSN
ncbi:MAG: trehalase-like domain-containing protein, partial [Planctomycetota bacterium]